MDPNVLPIETPTERWARRNFWLSVAALVLVEIILLGLVNAYPEMFPRRWARRAIRVEGATHMYLAVQAAVLVPVELALAYFCYQGRGSRARWTAAAFGAWILLYGVVVELLLATVRVPITTWHVLFLLYVALSHLAYGVFGSSERRPSEIRFWWASREQSRRVRVSGLGAGPGTLPGSADAGLESPRRAFGPPGSTLPSARGLEASPRTLAPGARAAQATALRALERTRAERRDAAPHSTLLGRLTMIGAIIGVMVGVLRAADDGVLAIPVGGVIGATIGRAAGILFLAFLDRLSSR